MNTHVARISILVLVSFLLLFTVLPLFKNAEQRQHEFIEQSFLRCVSALCILDPKIGEACTFLQPKVSEVLIAVDENNPNLRKVVVSLTSAECE